MIGCGGTARAWLLMSRLDAFRSRCMMPCPWHTSMPRSSCRMYDLICRTAGSVKTGELKLAASRCVEDQGNVMPATHVLDFKLVSAPLHEAGQVVVHVVEHHVDAALEIVHHVHCGTRHNTSALMSDNLQS